ncbi:MAG: hypothetical protein HRU18_03020 [Pseudoalteromonas sp.]|uniref:hypothetical protein n=1 Tax=Pseudoalteromonas sp. TaxID=53249 RepID=UPI001D3C7C4F|nr:hypothetical protein [Pseudoalteromonas sp.]NRA77156.1 hypothetical protein [Pseudoalteromonas sp.]
MKTCKWCKKDMPGAHPNKVFCSNKGKQNCKDLFNNRIPSRIEKAKEYSGHNARVARAANVMYIVPNSDINYYMDFDEDPSWDAHKDN